MSHLAAVLELSDYSRPSMRIQAAKNPAIGTVLAGIDHRGRSAEPSPISSQCFEPLLEGIGGRVVPLTALGLGGSMSEDFQVMKRSRYRIIDRHIYNPAISDGRAIP